MTLRYAALILPVIIVLLYVPDCRAVGSWATWSSWSSCNSTCGGQSYRVRFCVGAAGAQTISYCDPRATTHPDDDPAYQTDRKPCSDACPVSGDGQWSSWSTWSKCSVTCGQGVRYRARHCLVDGTCVGEIFSNQNCTLAVCSVDGQWSTWGGWSDCNTQCGVGFTDRFRQCNDPAPAGNGANCSGRYVDIKQCTGSKCPVDGGWTDFVDFPCSVTCGLGVIVSMRNCTNPEPLNGGSDCVGEATVFNKCTPAECVTDGGWTAWSDSSTCGVICGHGYTRRTRTCTNPPPSPNGQDCVGPGEEKTLCGPGTCPIDIHVCDIDVRNVTVSDNVTYNCQNTTTATQTDNEDLVDAMCSPGLDKTKWRLGLPVRDHCDSLPLYIPIGEVEAGTTKIINYGVMTDCYRNKLSMILETCDDTVLEATYDLSVVKEDFHLLLF